MTCGAGASRGFRNWAEVTSAGAAGQFANAKRYLKISGHESVFCGIGSNGQPLLVELPTNHGVTCVIEHEAQLIF